MLVLACLLALLAPAAPGGAAQGAEPVIVALGDSLTAGYGVAAHEAYPALLEDILRREGYRHRVVNAGVTGDTTAGGLRRVDWVLQAHPHVAIVALGANDGLRGLSLAAMRENLERIVRRLGEGGARVLLAGMRVPPTTAPTTPRGSPPPSRPWPGGPARRSCRSCWTASPPSRRSTRRTASTRTPRATG